MVITNGRISQYTQMRIPYKSKNIKINLEMSGKYINFAK